MTEIELMLKKDREKLLQLYTRANTKSKISLLAADMISHSYLCETLGINLDDDEWFCSSDLVNLVKNIGLDIDSLFMSEIKINRDFYDKIFFETFNKFVGMSFRSYDYYYGMFKFKKLSKKDLMELIFDFLNTYDSILVKRFKSMLDNSQIIFTDKTWGEIRFFSSLNKNLIFVNSLFGFNVKIGSIITHELGHDFEKRIYDSIGGQKYWNYVDATPYNEVSSSFFEYAFINYLIENRVCSLDSDSCLHNYLLGILSYSYCVHLLYQVKYFNIDELDRLIIDDEKVARYASAMQEKINFYNLPSDVNDVININGSFIYGIGKLYSIYLYETYKSNPNEFKKEFRNALINYPTIGGIEAFANLGITEDVLVKGDALKRVLKNVK